jgi:hypothetical protein
MLAKNLPVYSRKFSKSHKLCTDMNEKYNYMITISDLILLDVSFDNSFKNAK